MNRRGFLGGTLASLAGWLGCSHAQMPVPRSRVEVLLHWQKLAIDAICQATSGYQCALGWRQGADCQRFWDMKNVLAPASAIDVGGNYQALEELDDATIKQIMEKFTARLDGEAPLVKPLITPPGARFEPIRFIQAPQTHPFYRALVEKQIHVHTVRTLLETGEAYWWLSRNTETKEVAAVYWLDSRKVRPRNYQSGQDGYHLYRRSDGQGWITLAAADVIHFSEPTLASSEADKDRGLADLVLPQEWTDEQVRDFVLAAFGVPREVACVAEPGGEIKVWGPLTQFHENTIKPRLRYIAEVMTRELASQWDERLIAFFHNEPLERTHLLADDSPRGGFFYTTQGVLTRNELRRHFGLPNFPEKGKV